MAGTVIDASVAVKWFLQEDRSGEARSLLRAGVTMQAPSCLFLEVTHAMWSAVRGGRTTLEALAGTAGVLTRLFPDPLPDLLVFTRATEIMRGTEHPIYDCIYIAAAAHLGGTLVTADERQFAAARRAKVDARLL